MLDLLPAFQPPSLNTQGFPALSLAIPGITTHFKTLQFPFEAPLPSRRTDE